MKICFVCTGNTCRSPMAEYFLKRSLADCPDVEIISAGIHAFPNHPASDESQIVMADKFGIDISSHRSSGISKQLLTETDRIYTMTQHHKQILLRIYPEFSAKIQTLAEAADMPEGDVSDPYGYNLAKYQETADQLYYLTSRLAEIIRAECQ